MTDYLAKFSGALPGGLRWSSGLDINSSQTPDALLTTVAAALGDMWTNGTYGLGSQYVPAVTLDELVLYTVDGTFHATSKVEEGLAHVGTSGDAAVADGSAMTILKRTAGLKRNQRGFLSFPAPVEGTLVAGKWTVPTRDRFGAALEAVRTTIQADGSYIFVHTGAEATKGGIPPYTKTVVTKLSASDKPGSREQRVNKQTATYS